VKAPATATAVLIISLVAWTYFYLVGLPLGASETVVVVGICAVAVMFVKFALGRFRKRTPAKRDVENS
jgi:Flp pilus assembly protein TadB